MQYLNHGKLKSSVFCRIRLCSPLKFNRCFRESVASIFGVENETSKKPAWKLMESRVTLVSLLAYSSTRKMEVIFFSETSIDFHWTTRRYISENRALHYRGCEPLKSYVTRSWYQNIFLHREINVIVHILFVCPFCFRNNVSVHMLMLFGINLWE
jgi:hypothetical protein